jgi:hypothetical protein
MADLELGLEMEHLNMIDTSAFRNFRIPLRPGVTTVGRNGNELHPWQVLGVVFLLHCYRFFRVAILGDEMGLGKVQRTLPKEKPGPPRGILIVNCVDRHGPHHDVQDQRAARRRTSRPSSHRQSRPLCLLVVPP